MIEIEDLWKQYQLGNTVDVGRNFREAVSQWFRLGFASQQKVEQQADKFWALREINLEISQGKSLGLIGHNGAGKSTLLKVLSRITKPTRGCITMNGTVSSLLEVGTGFHPELSGRENIYLYGAIMGMTKRDIALKFDEIVDYAGVEKFLDTPVKRYSSGMYVRLAFSIAAHVEPDILIVDEVLAVGDKEFREKCLGKMEDVAQSGRTVIFVSHNMSSITSLCEEVAWLDQGQIKLSGKTNDVVAAYKNHKLSNFSNELLNSLFEGTLRTYVEIDELSVDNISGAYSVCVDVKQDIVIRVAGTAKRVLDAATISISLYHHDTRLFTIKDVNEPLQIGTGGFMSEFVIPADTLSSNTYSLGVGIISAATGEWMWGRQVSEITIADPDLESSDYNVDIFKSLGTGQRVSDSSK